MRSLVWGVKVYQYPFPVSLSLLIKSSYSAAFLVLPSISPGIERIRGLEQWSFSWLVRCWEMESWKVPMSFLVTPAITMK